MSDQAGKKQCPHCKKEVDEKATKCPHCHSDLRNWFRRHPIWTLVLILIFVPIVISVISPSSSTPASHQVDIAAYKKSTFSHLARHYIEDSLKSPSTAKFSYSPVIKQDEKDPNSFEEISSVDSQNGFGATVRTDWSLKAHYIGADTEEAINEGSNWRIDEVYFNGKKVK